MRFYKNFDKDTIKVLSFDLDNTLYDCDSVIKAAENWFTQYLCDRYNLCGRELRCYSFWAKIKNQVLNLEPELANDVTMLRAKSLVTAFCQLKSPLPGGLDEALELTGLFRRYRSQGTVLPAVKSLLEDLRLKYRLVAVSNGNLDTSILGLENCFDKDFRPCLSGWSLKPAPDLFLQAAKFCKVSPWEILHIGDDPTTDVAGAVYSSCKCAWLRRGFMGLSPDERFLRCLPDVELDYVLELRNLLLDRL